MKELSLHILDIGNNSIRGKGTNIHILVNEDMINNLFIFEIEDDGNGIEPSILATIKDPFTTSRTMRKVGLGIPLLNENCSLCNGSLKITSELNKGTKLIAILEYDNIDRPPLGDISSTISGFITSNSNVNIKYTHRIMDKEFIVTTKELKDELDDIPLTDINIVQWLTGYIKENIDSLR